MKIYIPTSKSWYVAALVILMPIILVLFVEPAWAGRMAGISFGYVLLPILLLLFGLFRRQDYFGLDSPLYKRFSKNTIDFVARSIVVIFAAFAIFSLSLPFLKDVYASLRGEVPLVQEMYVANTRVNSITGLIMERVIVENNVETKENSYIAFFFSPSHIMHENSYEFLYLPNSRIILDARVISLPE